MIFKEIKQRAEELQSETAELLSRMIQTPSFSGKEKQMAALLQDEMTAAEFDEVKIDALGSVIGRIGEGRRLIAFDAHIDTVYPGEATDWRYPPHSGIIAEGRVWGRGASDQLGGMAALITAAKIIKELRLNQRFTILFTGTVMEEDCDGIAWEHLITEEGIIPELVLSTEPTSLNIYRGHRGRMEIEVETAGLSCHGSAPERGENAVYKMAGIVKEIEKKAKNLGYDKFLGKGSMTVSIFRSKSASQCSVPDKAEIVIDRRLTAGETKETAISEIRECCRQAGVINAAIRIPVYRESAYTGKVYEAEKYFPTWVLPPDSVWLQTARETYLDLFGKEPLIDKWTFSTNCVFIMGRHPEIKCLGFGPGDEKEAHSVNESIKISDLPKAAAFYAGLVAALNEEV
jgi:putative selenium metabolism hydrolase